MILDTLASSLSKQLERVSNSSSKLLIPTYRIPAPWTSSKRLTEYRGHVYAAVDLISDSVADIKFILKKGNPNNWKEVDSHPILDLIYNPSEIFDKDSLIKLMVVYYELFGEVFLYIERNDRGIPVSLFPLIPSRVTIVPAAENEEGLIKEYEYVTDDGATLHFEPAQIGYMRNPSPTNPLRGISTIEAAALAIDTDNFASEYNRNFFYNSAVPLGAFATDAELSDEAYNRLKADIKAKYGKGKAHSPALLEGGVKWMDVGLKQKDMDFLNQRKFSREEIFEVFKVPMSLVTSQDINLANAEAGERQFAKRVVKRLDNRITTFFNKSIVPAFGQTGMFLDFEDPTPENNEENRMYAETGKSTGVLSANEIRALLGYDLAEGSDADVPLVFLEGKSAEALDIRPKRIRSGHKSNITTVHKTTIQGLVEKIDKSIIEHSKKEVAKLPGKEVTIKSEDFVMFSDIEKSQIWKTLDSRTQDYEKVFESEIRNGFESQEVRVTRKVEQGGTNLDSLMNLPAERVSFIALLVPLLTRILATEGNKTLDFVGDTESVFDMEATRIVRYLSDYGLRFIDQVNNTTRDALIESLSKGIQGGESIPQLSNRVTQVYTEAKGYRAKTIARTEVGRAVSSARLEAFHQSEFVDGKTWLTSRDKNVRDTHNMVEGDTVKNNKLFKNGCMAPRVCDSAGESINCRCDLLPQLKQGRKFIMPHYTSVLDVGVSRDYQLEVVKGFVDELNRQYYIASGNKKSFDWMPKSAKEILNTMDNDRLQPGA